MEFDLDIDVDTGTGVAAYAGEYSYLDETGGTRYDKIERTQNLSGGKLGVSFGI